MDGQACAHRQQNWTGVGPQATHRDTGLCVCEAGMAGQISRASQSLLGPTAVPWRQLSTTAQLLNESWIGRGGKGCP